MALFDSTTVAAIATGVSGVVAAFLLRTGRRTENSTEDDRSAGGVSLAKELADQQRADFRSRIRDLEKETRDLRAERDRASAERDQLRYENEYLTARIRELGGQ